MKEQYRPPQHHFHPLILFSFRSVETQTISFCETRVEDNLFDFISNKERMMDFKIGRIAEVFEDPIV